MNRITRLLVSLTALALLASACGGANEAAEAPPPTEAPATSDAEGDGESDESGESDETSAVPSTTEAPATTTTRPPPPANGVLVASEGVLGWVIDGVLFANDNGAAPAAAGDEYRLLRPEGVTGTAVGPAPELGCLGATPFIDLGVSADSWPYDFPIGVSGTWDLFPQAVEVMATENQIYKDITRDLVAQFGLDDPDPQLLQVLRVDLEGDGVDEVLVVAERLQGGGLAGAQAGDYSIVYLRKVIGNEVQQLVLHHSALQNLAPDAFGYLEAFRVPTVADLDGDGQMEIVTQGFYYEGSWTEMWEYVENGQGEAVVTLSVGCGV
jgi:hypothetical protein